jgi:hypothetical protein
MRRDGFKAHCRCGGESASQVRLESLRATPDRAYMPPQPSNQNGAASQSHIVSSACTPHHRTAVCALARRDAASSRRGRLALQVTVAPAASSL